MLTALIVTGISGVEPGSIVPEIGVHPIHVGQYLNFLSCRRTRYIFHYPLGRCLTRNQIIIQVVLAKGAFGSANKGVEVDILMRMRLYGPDHSWQETKKGK